MLTKHYDITESGTILEFYLNGLYYFYVFNNEHKIINKEIWNITTLI